jgi:N-methylhydantoinase A
MYADIISEFSVSRYAETRQLDFAAANEALAIVEARARAFLDDLRDIEPESTRVEFLVAARYPGQVWELDIPLASFRFERSADVAALEERFHAIHRRVFAVDEPGQYLECLVWKSRATAVTTKPSVSARRIETPDGIEKRGTAYFRDAGLIDTAIFAGPMLAPGTRLTGPAIIREPTTTVVVYPGSTVTVTALGNYLLEIGAEPRQLIGAGVARDEVTRS